MKVSKVGLEVSKLLVANKHQAYLVGECVLALVVPSKTSARVEIATNADITELFTLFTESDAYSVLYTTNDKVVARATGTSDAFTVSIYKTIYDGAARTVEEYLFSKGINVYSMGYDAIKEEIIDPLNVQKDIADKVVKVNSKFSFIHDSRTTFKLAFVCAELGYILDGKSAMYAAKDAYGVEFMATATIRNSLNRYFSELKNPSIALRVLDSVGILKKVLPELAYSKGCKLVATDTTDLYNHTLKIIDVVPKGRSLVRWAALFHDLGKMHIGTGCNTTSAKSGNYRDNSARLVMEVMGRLLFSKKEIFKVERIVKNEVYLHYSLEKELLLFINNVGAENVQDILLLEASHRLSGAYAFETTRSWLAMFRRRIHYLMVKEELFTIKDLAVNGYDLMRWFKIGQGEIIGDILTRLFQVAKYNVFANNVTSLKQLSTHYYNGKYKST